MGAVQSVPLQAGWTALTRSSLNLALPETAHLEGSCHTTTVLQGGETMLYASEYFMNFILDVQKYIQALVFG